MIFTPPPIKPVENEWQWATYIESRAQKFKVHRSEKNARAALNLRNPWNWQKTRGGTLYKIVGDQWQEQETIHPKESVSGRDWREWQESQK